MHDHQVLIFTALMIFLFGLVSKVSERWLITGPMVFAGVGVLVSPIGLDLFTLHASGGTVKLIAEITLMLILFVDATLIDTSVLRNAPGKLPTRLLGIGLPLTMCLGFGFGVMMFPDVNWWVIALVALILSPTDAALGQAVVKSEMVPDHIRQSISVESGLNDGIALPPILMCLAALGADASEHQGSWLLFMLKQLGFGVLVGGLVGWVGSRLMDQVSALGWMESTFQRLSALSLALLAFALAEALGGNGFIAAFCGGLAVSTGSPEIRERIHEYGEAEGTLLSMGVFLVFGLAMIPLSVEFWSWRVWVYALASLTVIRMVPVAIALWGSGMDRMTTLFIGWFGPRGIASVLYILIAASAIGVDDFRDAFAVIVLVVTLSIYAHGISAIPFCRALGKRTASVN
ncbi:MAG: cation:proton antiporter [Pseudomonadales bacterium]